VYIGTSIDPDTASEFTLWTSQVQLEVGTKSWSSSRTRRFNPQLCPRRSACLLVSCSLVCGDCQWLISARCVASTCKSILMTVTVSITILNSPHTSPTLLSHSALSFIHFGAYFMISYRNYYVKQTSHTLQYVSRPVSTAATVYIEYDNPMYPIPHYNKNRLPIHPFPDKN
jgi:hypothetical protein